MKGLQIPFYKKIFEYTELLYSFNLHSLYPQGQISVFSISFDADVECFKINDN